MTPFAPRIVSSKLNNGFLNTGTQELAFIEIITFK